MDHSKKRASATADLTDDLIVEILSRLPAKSICRFKCVSWHWYGLITNPEHRKKIPQTLSGFFYRSYKLNHEKDMVIFPDFVGIMGDEEQPFSDPSLTFITGYKLIIPKICCNGLLFCLCWKVYPRDESDYVVCNPATEKWVVLPESGDESIALVYCFGFDPAISPYFYVFQITDEDDDYGYIDGVNIYSPETGAWSRNKNGWGNELHLVDRGAVFLNGMLHLLTYDFKILAVDTQGKRWRTIPLLETMTVSCFWKGPEAFIGQSQGLLYYINMRAGDTSKLSVWILEGYDSGEWIFKYSINTSQIFGEKDLMFERDYALIAIHPECNLIYFVWRCEDMLMSYDMDRGKVCVSSLKEHLYDRPFLPYLPYVPFLSDSLSATRLGT
ncbi:hypothetical protein SETIT_9G354900v2 [Setaria italica]|uniref:F-box domain-containing protein n=1 Tax=Setaria italica TaxID=4555 RepID=K4AKR7_SETIT|nr:F-box protein At5g07610 [Setaria italica]RCV44199.1 hypothetical protein SETIT_9G354900v2 [Setaria italica]